MDGDAVIGDTYEEKRLMHRRREEMVKNGRAWVEALATLAGFQVSNIWELANGYWPLSPEYDDVRHPWWLLQTEIGLVQIGRRKSVIAINWSACAFLGVVTEDDVTKSDRVVHAWSDEKAVEYLRALREQATLRALREQATP